MEMRVVSANGAVSLRVANSPGQLFKLLCMLQPLTLTIEHFYAHCPASESRSFQIPVSLSSDVLSTSPLIPPSPGLSRQHREP